MPGYTQKLGLYEYDTTTDGALKFNVDNVLKNNFRKIDDFASTVDSSLDNKQNASTAVKHELNTAVGSATEPVYVDSDGNVVKCSKSIEDTRFDGPYVSSVLTLSTAKAVGVYPISLSSYLPNDNYNYEVDLFAWISSIHNVHTKLYFGSSNVADNKNLILVGDSYYTNYEQEISSRLIKVVDNRSNYLIIKNHGCYALQLLALGYRRIGTNS